MSKPMPVKPKLLHYINIWALGGGIWNAYLNQTQRYVFNVSVPSRLLAPNCRGNSNDAQPDGSSLLEYLVEHVALRSQ